MPLAGYWGGCLRSLSRWERRGVDHGRGPAPRWCMDARSTAGEATQLRRHHCRPLHRDQFPGVPNRTDSWRVVTGDVIGRGPIRVARVGEGRPHDRCPRRAWNRWHHRLDRSCACGPVFREALNHASRLGPEGPGSPRSFLNLPRSTKARLARRAGPSGSFVGRSVTRPSTGPTPGRHRCRPRRPHASHPPSDPSGRTEAARSPAW